MIILVTGPAGSGKTTIAQLIKKHLEEVLSLDVKIKDDDDGKEGLDQKKINALREQFGDNDIIVETLTTKKLDKPKSGRIFARISPADLDKKIVEVGERCESYEEMDNDDELSTCAYALVQDRLMKDLKVEFTLENYAFKKGEFGPDELMGINTLDNGLTFLGCCAGGDWESPVFFIIYFDGKKLRAYIPTRGNVFNLTTMKAYGNADLAEEGQDDVDTADVKKRTNGQCESRHEIEFNIEELKADILERLVSA